MKYRTMGKTRLKVSEVGFGCGNIGGLMIRGSRRERVEAVRLALELGINYFDTASSYGDGRSESNLGQVLTELEPEIILATKVRLSPDDLNDIPSTVQQSLKASLSRLKRDHIDIIQLHSRVASKRDSRDWSNALSIEDVLGKDGVADAFQRLRDQNLTRFIGFTGLGEAKAIHKIVESRRFEVIQAYFNLLNPSAGYKVPEGFDGYDFKQLIDNSARHEMGVAAIRVMAAGALGGEDSRKGYAAPTVRGPMVPGPDYNKDKAKAGTLEFLLHGHTRNLPQAALKFVLMHPGVSTALVGFSNQDQIKEAAETSELRPLPQPHIERLKELWGQSVKEQTD